MIPDPSTMPSVTIPICDLKDVAQIVGPQSYFLVIQVDGQRWTLAIPDQDAALKVKLWLG
jgi:hypothetical protein